MGDWKGPTSPLSTLGIKGGLDKKLKVCFNKRESREATSSPPPVLGKTTIEDETMSANTSKRTTATTLTRDLTDKSKHLTCPECGGVNGSHKLNQPCDFCGFTLTTRLFPDHERYVRGLSETASGRDTYDIADITADDLRGLSVDDVIKTTAKALAQQPIDIGLSVKLGRQFKKSGYTWTTNGIKAFLAGRYEGRNNGMVRMNCGNVLRSSRKRLETLEA